MFVFFSTCLCCFNRFVRLHGMLYLSPDNWMSLEYLRKPFPESLDVVVGIEPSYRATVCCTIVAPLSLVLWGCSEDSHSTFVFFSLGFPRSVTQWLHDRFLVAGPLGIFGFIWMLRCAGFVGYLIAPTYIETQWLESIEMLSDPLSRLGLCPDWGANILGEPLPYPSPPFQTRIGRLHCILPFVPFYRLPREGGTMAEDAIEVDGSFLELA
jgi:hypothetical protein